MITPAQIPTLLTKYGSLRAIGRAEGLHYTQVHRAYAKAVEAGLLELLPLGRKTHASHKTPTLKQRDKAQRTKKASHTRYILTCAQNNTLVHEQTWENIQALARHYDAEIYVSTFLYANRSHWQKNLDKARATKGERGKDELWFDPKIVPHINNDRVEIAKSLVWCGELNISPTAARPLSGLEVYTGRKSMIVPHTHVAMQSIATIGGAAKLNYSTGTVTRRNYIQRKEGFKAEFHHCYGGLLVEVADDGTWFVRQLSADSDGTIQDLDVLAQGGNVTVGNPVEAITFGDVHVANIDSNVAEATWGKGGMVDQLKPRYQFIHDVLDFFSRSHHTIKDPYKRLARHVNGVEDVALEVAQVGLFLDTIKRDGCETVVVDSNHDRHLSRWLRENDGRFDAVNAKFWSWLNNAVVDHITEQHEEPANLLEFTLKKLKLTTAKVATFLDTDTSFVICDSKWGGIETALHGDAGANGARGGIRSFAKMGRRSNIGHSHSAGIDGGCYQTGTKSKLKLEYAHGLSSWSHSDIVTYPNGKRAIITFFNNQWRAH